MATLDRNNPFQVQLFEKLVTDYLKEYLNNTQFSRFVGDASSIIHKRTQSKGAGDTIIFPTRQTFMPVVRRGTEQLVGNENEITLVTDEVRIDTLRFATRITNEQLLEIQSKTNFDSHIRADLLQQASLMNTKRTVSQFALAFSPTTVANRSLINMDYSYADLNTLREAAGINTNNAAGDAVSNERLMFGLDYWTNQPDVVSTVDDANFSVANGHTMCVKHISKLFNLASVGGRAAIVNKEAAIRPYKVQSPHNGYTDNRYVLFVAPETYYHMRDNDAEWRSQVVRGTVEVNSQPTELYGAAYKGSIEGVDVVIVNEFSNFITTTGNGGTQVAYSALCGASAMGMAYGGIPQFKLDSRDYDMHHGIAHEEISGFKVLKYPSKGNPLIKGNNPLLIENGIVHSFVKIT